MTQEEVRKIARPLQWRVTKEKMWDDDLYEAVAAVEGAPPYSPTFEISEIGEYFDTGKGYSLYSYLGGEELYEEFKFLDDAEEAAEAHYLDFVASLLK